PENTRRGVRPVNGKIACDLIFTGASARLRGERSHLNAGGNSVIRRDIAATPPACEAPMVTSLSAPEVLNREFLEIRCTILELAASCDRLDRADGSVAEDPRPELLREALAIVLEGASDRAEQVQMVFSRTYDDDWQETLGIAPT